MATRLCLLLLLSILGLWAFAIAIVQLRLSLRAYNFVRQEVDAAAASNEEAFYTQNLASLKVRLLSRLALLIYKR
jgi:hypothetical protein